MRATNSKRQRTILLFSAMAVCSVAQAQVPDLLNALDSGGRAMGMGGASRVTDGNTYSILDNPAGLVYAGNRTFELSFRNLPSYTTAASGNFNDRTNATKGAAGKMAISHLGTTFDFNGGTLGVSFTTTGYLNSLTTGNGLQNNGLTVVNLREETRAQIDMFTVSYGKRMRDLNVGYGLIVANSYANATQSYVLLDSGNNQVGSTNSNISGNGIGFGAVIGVQGTMQGSDTMAWGASLRTPIDLSGNGNSADVLDRIPGKFSFGLAGRKDQFMGGNEFLSWGIQGDYYFGGQGGKIIPRDSVFGLGAGIEYNMYKFNGRIPFRLGYSYVPGGGSGFTDRNALTFGIGYRPTNQNFSFDLNFAKARGTGAMDMAFGISYRPSN